MFVLSLINFMTLPSTFLANKKDINAIIESPKGSSVKYTFDEKTELFQVSKLLPKGMVFPLHFGFIPSTKGEDGDPLDVLVLMDEHCYPGSLIEVRVIGAIEANQTEKNGKTVRNDRIIGAALESSRYSQTTIKSLDKYLLDEVKNFFITYNAMANKKFTPLRQSNATTTIQLIKRHEI